LSASGSILDSLGAARRFADPSGPLAARRMAAGGALPLPPPQLASALVALTSDPDAEVCSRASDSLMRLPASVVDQVLAAPVHPDVLDWFARASADDEARLQKIALNAATSDRTFCFVATRPFPRLIELVASNQVRLLRCPALVDALGENPTTGHATIDRILHFLGVERRAEEEPPAEAAQPVPESPAPAPEVNADSPFELDDTSDLPPELIDEPEGDAKTDADGPDKRSLTAQIQDMSVMQKIKLGIFGNSEARSILIRDRNRLVATSVIRSPKITESEVTSFAKARNLCDDVYRIIANNRAWTKSYPVKLALTTNAKVAPATAIKFLNYLTDRDLKMIMRSRDVSGPVSTQARRLLAKKGKT
jgi:hypothetical protein